MVLITMVRQVVRTAGWWRRMVVTGRAIGRRLATEVRGRRQAAAIRKNVLRYARVQLLLPLLHFPGPAPGFVPGVAVPVRGKGVSAERRPAKGLGTGERTITPGAGSHCFNLAFRQFVNTPFRVGSGIRSRWVAGPSVQAAVGPPWPQRAEGGESIPRTVNAQVRLSPGGDDRGTFGPGAWGQRKRIIADIKKWFY